MRFNGQQPAFPGVIIILVEFCQIAALLRKAPETVDVGPRASSVVSENGVTHLGLARCLIPMLPVIEPARHQIEPVFARGIEQIKPDFPS